MANLESATTGSLAEHDIVLSISEEAINRQFQFLYNKPIHTDKSLPPPPGTRLPSGAVTASAQFLINHELRIYRQYTNKAKHLAFDNKTGIFAHIKSLKISLQTDEVNTAILTFEFVRVEGAAARIANFEAGSVRHLTWRSWPNQSMDGRCHGKSRSVSTSLEISKKVGGILYSFVFALSMEEHSIDMIHEDLVQPAQGNSKPIVTHPNTVEALKAVDPRGYTVASIFCILEVSLIADSFTILTEKGEKPDQNTNDFMLLISHCFHDLQQAGQIGAPTPDIPYVLGYGLSQKVPNLKVEHRDKTQSTPVELSTSVYYLPTKTSENDGVMGFAEDINMGQVLWTAAGKCLPYRCDRSAEKAGFWLNDGIVIVLGVRDARRQPTNVDEEIYRRFRRNSIKNKVIMPAGNVFNYAGVDIDSQGNLFVHISFALGAEGVNQTKDPKNQTGMTG